MKHGGASIPLQVLLHPAGVQVHETKRTGAERFCKVMKKIVGKRLSFDELTGQGRVQFIRHASGLNGRDAANKLSKQLKRSRTGLMKPASVGSTLEFQRFKNMRKLLAVPKQNLMRLWGW